MKRLWIVPVLLFALLASSCGYRLVGYGSAFPEHIHTLYIPYFINETKRFELEQRVTEEVQRQFTIRKRFSLAKRSDEADAMLEGVITKFTVKAVGFDDESRANRYQITMNVSAKFVDRTTDEVLWENPNFIFRSEYDADETTVDYVNLELNAIDAMAKDFAETLVSTITQGF